MASSLRALLRFLLPQQQAVPYMESKIPLPTDNIFKFYALFSLFLFVFSIAAVIYTTQASNDRVLRFYPELEGLRQTKVLTPHDEARKAVLERLFEVQKADKKFYMHGLGVLAGLSFWGMLYGFWRWHREVQPRLDEASRVQLEIAKLQLVRLQAEIARENSVGKV